MKTLAVLSGSCTTGCTAGQKMIFGSTFESIEPTGTGKIDRLKYLLGRKKAAGITDDYVRLYVGNAQNGFSELLKYQKDCLPAGLCQFGRINVEFNEYSGELVIYPQAVKKIRSSGSFVP